MMNDSRMWMRKNAMAAVCLCALAVAAPLHSQADADGSSLRWRDCVALAQSKNPDIISANEKINQAAADRGIARSDMLPSVSASLAASRSKREGGAESVEGTRNSFSYGIEGSQLLFDGGRAYFETKGAGSLYKKAVYGKMAASASVRLAMRTAFNRLLSAQESVGIVKEITDRRERNLDLVRIRYNAGKEHRGSLMTAEVSLAQAKADYAQALRAVSLARGELARRIGLRDWKAFAAAGELAVPRVSPGTPDFRSIAERTPSFLQARVQEEYAGYARKSALAGHSPRMYGNANAGRSGSSWPPEETTLSAGVTITLPILEGGAGVYRDDKADAAYRQAAADLESARRTAELALEQKWVALLYAIDICGVREQSLKASEERARIAEARYNIGMINFDNWIIIENELADAKRNYLNARAGVLDAEAEWYNAQGVTLDHDIQ